MVIPTKSDTQSNLLEIRSIFRDIFERIKLNKADESEYEKFQVFIELMTETKGFATRKQAVNFILFPYFMKKHSFKNMVDFYKKRKEFLAGALGTEVNQFQPHVISMGDDILAHLDKLITEFI